MKPIRPVLLVVLAALMSARFSPAEEPPSFRFTDVSRESGLAEVFHGAYHHAMAWGDFDGDGRFDLFLGNFAERQGFAKFGLKKCKPNMLVRQSAAGKFELFPSPAVEIPGRCSGAAFVDLDNDGDLDLYVTSNTKLKLNDDEPRRTAQAQGCRLYRNDGGGKFVDVSQGSGACPAGMFRSREVGVLDYDGDGLLDLLVMQDRGIDPDDKVTGARLFHNRGNFKFEDVASKVGLPDDLWGAGVVVADLNGDRRPDFYVCGGNRLYLSQPENKYREAADLRPVFNQPEKELDWVCGASFGDLDRDGDLDLITGRHHYYGPSRIHVYLNEGLRDSVPRFREITREIGLVPLPQKAPHPEIADFDNDGIPDLYWSVFFIEDGRRRPFICKGRGVEDGLPRYDVPATASIKPAFDMSGKITNDPPASGLGMVYYVNGPALDFDGDGDLDLCVGNWPPEGCRVYRNDTRGGNWLQVRVEGKKMNRMGVGAQVRIYSTGAKESERQLLGFQEITQNGGYSSSRPALAHFGLGKVAVCDVEVTLPSRREAIVLPGTKVNQRIVVGE